MTFTSKDAAVGEGGRALLFDRLTDLNREQKVEDKPFRFLSRDALLESIHREISRILNTRSTTPLAELEAREWTVVDYGLPDFAGWYTHAASARGKLAELARRAILSFEPRLHNPAVTVLPDAEDEHTLRLLVEGAMRIGQSLEPVAFPIDVGKNGKQ